MGKLITKPRKITKEFDGYETKLQLTLIALADKFNEQERKNIYNTYNNKTLQSRYTRVRNSKVYDHGGKSKVYKKLIEFPNASVFMFVDTVLTELYDKDWMNDNRALKHDLVRPWWVVNKI